MSSEKIHITRHNYEEYFLLYVDNELSPADRMAVEGFAAAHPDLQEELDLLMQTTILQVPVTELGDKSFLMADNMKLNAIDDTLLLYIDDELAGEQKKRVEEMLQTLPEYKLQYDVLLTTKLVKEEFSYPYKNELYRHTERKFNYSWMRVAAAIMLIAALGLVYLLQGGSTEQPPVVANKSKVTNPQVQPSNQVAAIIHRPTENAGSKLQVDPVIIQRSAPQYSNADQEMQQTAEVRLIDEKRESVFNPVMANRDIHSGTSTPVAGIDLEKLNNSAVTPAVVGTYISKGHNVVQAQDYAVTENQKNGSVRGLLRKATRFIEKRTGLNPVNDDDELLIGALAIKLK